MHDATMRGAAVAVPETESPGGEGAERAAATGATGAERAAATAPTGASGSEQACPAPGLRERNRLRRTRRVERAALSLALEHGLDAVTVDMICEAGDVSPRTFFNYFGTKEGALIGSGPVVPTGEAAEAFVASTGPLLEDLMLVLAHAFLDSEPDRDVFLMRRRLFEAEPELATQQMARVAGKRQAVVSLVARRLRSQEPDMTDDAARDEGHLVMSLAMGAFHVVAREWIDSGGHLPEVEPQIRAALHRIRRLVVTD